MNQPLVSIIIPCYNTERYVGEAITSALEQTYRPIEVIVVDDGSTDKSMDVIRSFGDSVRIVEGAHQGAAAARNKGVAASHGQLIQFLDADDLLYPSKLERQVPLACAHPLDMVFCDADSIDLKTGRYRGRWGAGFVSASDSVVHTLLTVVQTSGPIHWRETFDRVGGFREHTPPCDDRDLHLRIACSGARFHHLPECLYVMRRIEGSLSKKAPTDGQRMLWQIGMDAYEYLTGQNELNEERRAAFAGYFARTARSAFRLGMDDFAEQCLSKAEEMHEDRGFPLAYSPKTRRIAQCVGPKVAEHLISLKRFFFRNGEIA